MGAYLIDAYLIDAYFNDDWGIDALRGACWGGACRGRFSLGWAVVRVCGFVWVGKKDTTKISLCFFWLKSVYENIVVIIF